MKNTFAEQKFLVELQKELLIKGKNLDLEFIHEDVAVVRHKSEMTNLIVFANSDSNEVFLYEKKGVFEKCLLKENLNLNNVNIFVTEIIEKLNLTMSDNSQRQGKVLFEAGQIWKGRNFADLINKMFKKNYIKFMRCYFRLDKFHADGIAWIVFINGEPHGQNDYLWINTLSDDEETIVERYVGFNEEKIANEFFNLKRDSFCNRLTFMRDPNNVGNAFEAKCLGYYTLKSYDINRLERVWIRKAKSLVLDII